MSQNPPSIDLTDDDAAGQQVAEMVADAADADMAAVAAAAEPDERIRAVPKFQSQRFMLTLWDKYMPDEWDGSDIMRVFENKGAWYACWGYEAAPTTGEMHYHVYVRFEHKRASTTICNYFKTVCGKNLFIEKPLGNEKQVRDYCWCEGEHAAKLPSSNGHGELNPANFDPKWHEMQGKRSDLEAIRDALKEGKDEAWVAENHPGDFMRMHGGIAKMKALLGPKAPLRREVEVVLLWGPSDTGKTHRVMTGFDDVFLVEPGRSPFDAYNGEVTIFFDEWNHDQYPITKMNKFLDVWRCPIDCRYNNKYAAWTRVVICANSPPATYYAMEPPMLQEAFRRRIRGRCWEVTSRGPTLAEIMATPPTPL